MKRFLGIDVSKDTLDAFVRPDNLHRRFDNSAAGIADLVAWARVLTPERIVCESTGPYQKAAIGRLAKDTEGVVSALP